MSVASRNVLDLITHDPALNEYVLIMVEDRPWIADDNQVEDLLAKFKAYFAYAVDGGLIKAYPDASGSSVRIQLDSFASPPLKVRTLLQRMARIADEYAIRVVLHVMGPGGQPGALEPI